MRKPDFSGASLKVLRAKRHISDLDAELTRYFSRYPHGVTQLADLEKDRFGWLITEIKPLPRHFPLLVGDAVHNLRSSLDYLIAAIAAANGRTFRDTSFPIVKRKADLPARLKKDVRKAGPIAQKLVRDVKPYQRGNRALYAIHQLDLIDKHQLIVPVATVQDVTLSTGLFDGKPLMVASGRLYSFHRKTQFIPAPKGCEFDIPHNIRFSGDIVFARGRPLSGQSCIAALNMLADETSSVIHRFEASFP